jgi:hypothetical protein
LEEARQFFRPTSIESLLKISGTSAEIAVMYGLPETALNTALGLLDLFGEQAGSLAVAGPEILWKDTNS